MCISSKKRSGWCRGYGLGRVQPPNSTSRSLNITSVAPALGDGYEPGHRTAENSSHTCECVCVTLAVRVNSRENVCMCVRHFEEQCSSLCVCVCVPEASGRIHSLLFRSSLHKSLNAALQLLCVQPPNTYIDWFES